MPLRFNLGPFEKLFIGKSVLTNGGSRTEFIVEGDTPILRARDVLAPEQAVNTAQKLYHCVQQMYLEQNSAKYHGSFVELAARAVSECAAWRAEIETADRLIKSGQHYKALKELAKIRSRAFAGDTNKKAGSLPRVEFSPTNKFSPANN